MTATRAEAPPTCALRLVRQVRESVACDGAALVVMDPVTALFSTGAVDALPEASCHPYFRWELSDAPRTFRRMALDRASASSVDLTAADDDLVRTVLVPHGYAAEARVVCEDGQAVWGGLSLWRAAGRAPFTAPEVAVLDRMSGRLGHALREAVVRSLAGPAGDGAGVGEPAVLLFEDSVLSESSPEALALLGEPSGEGPAEYRHLEHLRALTRGPLPFTTVLRSEAGWLTAHGTALGSARVVVTLTAAGPDRLLGPRVVAARLTRREVEVTRLVCRGLSDREIARELDVTEHTAHDHVRAVRRKLGVRSRTEVSALIFADRWFDGFLASAALSHG